jgi:hypothetical protein
MRWWGRRAPVAAVPALASYGLLGEAEAGRTAVRAVAALVTSEHAEVHVAVREGLARDPEAFAASLVALAGVLAQSLPEPQSTPGSLAWWALRHEVVVTQRGGR